MDLEVQQAKISLGDHYSILINGVEKYTAQSRLFRFLSDITVSDLSEKPLVSIKKRFSFLKANYDILLNDSEKYQLTTKSIWRSSYYLKSHLNTYEIFEHRGRKYSVYMNGTQIGFFIKDLVTVFDGDTYQAKMNDDLDPLLITSIIICIDNYGSKNSSGNTVTFDLGNIGPEGKPFDSTWRPQAKS